MEDQTIELRLWIFYKSIRRQDHPRRESQVGKSIEHTSDRTATTAVAQQQRDPAVWFFFRNTLLHHKTTVEKLKQLDTDGNIVYTHIFDPDVVSLYVKVATKPELLFSVYATAILDIAQKEDKKKLPSILSSSYCFQESDENAVINKLFALNSKINKVLHSRLPSAGYFSECNTLLLYDEKYWEKLKFYHGKNEIMPIVRRLVSEEKKKALFIEGALQTSVPSRMEPWQNCQDEQCFEVDFFRHLEKCSQVPLTPVDWGYRVYSAISPYISSGEKRFLKDICALWIYYSPTLSFKNYATVDKKSFRDFIHSGYDDHLQNDEASLKTILKTLKEYPLTETWKFSRKKLWNFVAGTAESCGKIYKNHIVSWWRENSHTPADEDEGVSFNLDWLFDMGILP